MFFQRKGFKDITPDELQKKRDEGQDIFLLDVRTPGEFAHGAIDGAHLLPVQELSSRIRELPRDREIIVYCRVGNRSAFAASHLAQLGYTVTNLEGGIMAWSDAHANMLAAVS